MRKDLKTTLDEVRIKYRVHDRAFTRRDFYRICKAENIEVVQSASVSLIFYFSGSYTIALDRRAKGPRRTFEAYHELGHYFLEHDAQAPDPNKERDADAFACLATESPKPQRPV